ncbi:PepSY domain-containing protein [Nonomuraea typhae]|uniref:PepSY domain-containing protein n=1 Tax=Nonomuraea typhae TaxID=2603600 RepID=A0ABW7Z4A6_9ACTN
MAAALLATAACGTTSTTGTNAAEGAKAAAGAQPWAGSAASPSGPTDAPLESPDATGTPTTSPGAGGAVAAGAAALAAVSGTVTEIDRAGDTGVWRVVVVGEDGTENYVRVDNTGKVVAGPSAEANDPMEKAAYKALADAAKVTYTEAADKVTAEAPGAEITELQLDMDKGVAVWEAKTVTPDGARKKVKINAADGSVVTPPPPDGGYSTPWPTSTG